MGRRAVETYRTRMSMQAGVDAIEEMLRAVS
jgi:hypothetical protein